MINILFILSIISITFCSYQHLYSNENNKQLRMKLIGYYNGDNKDIRTYEDQKQDDNVGYSFTVDKTCLTINTIELTGNHKNVKITVHCGVDGFVLFSKNKTDIKGKFQIKWKGIEKKFLKECYQEDPLQFSVVVLDIESDNEIYRGEVTSDFCEGD